MKIDRSKLKKSSSEVPADCKTLIERIKACPESDLLQVLSDVKSWTYGKCELYHWADVLDQFDGVLEKGCAHHSNNSWTMACDLPEHDQLKLVLLEVVRFTALLIEHSFSRHLYSSMEHLISLLASCDMMVVLAVLNLLYVFSKRSNFITRMNPEKRQALIVRLQHLAESWGGKENGFGLAECCKDLPATSYPASATTLHFEFYVEHKEEKSPKKGSNAVQSIHMENLDRSKKLPTQIMEELLENFAVPSSKQVLLYTHIRLAHLFPCYMARIQCVQARLQAISILVYANAIQDNLNVILYPGLIEELVDIIEIPDNSLVEIKSAALRTLTSIIHIDRNPKLVNIIDTTGAASYHGFLPVLVRTCIQHMIDQELEPFPQQYATALFSFLYHLASYENGVEALVACGMMEALLKVINWYSEGQEHITFVTRAVRVIDLITNIDMPAFQAHGGLQAFINRLEHEVSLCRREQPFVVRPQNRVQSVDSNPESPPAPVEMETSQSGERSTAEAVPSTSSNTAGSSVDADEPRTGVQCFPQRAALLKSMLNFLKKAIPDNAFTESIRHLMDGSLPRSLKHIISNAEYYGPSLFLLATDVVTVYVFQEPSLLSSLQDKGLTDVVLHALLIKDVPATREVLASLPNVFSALCLNARGLEAFVACRPFDRLFKVLLSPDYLPAMRRRRSADPFGDTASNLGNAMDELMRHQPSLRTDATKAIIKLLEEICSMGQDPKFICQKQQPKTEQSTTSPRSPQPVDGGSSEEEEEEEDIPAASSSNQAASTSPADAAAAATAAVAVVPVPAVSSASAKSASQESMQSKTTHDRQAIPLMEYVLNVMKFVEAILSNNSTDDHCREFVTQKGLLPLMGILGLPNLPIDFPASPACQAVASVCKSILSLSREPQVMKQGLLHLNEVLQKLEPLHRPLGDPGGSVLLQELAAASCQPDATLSPQATPLLHALAAAHAYITMFVHVCRMGQNDIRTISVSHWGSELGLTVLQGLSQLYTSLVWESTVLLALCSDDILPPGCQFGRADMDRIIPQDVREAHLRDAVAGSGEGSSQKEKEEEGGPHSNGMSAAMESLTTSETVDSPMEVSTSVDAPSTSASSSGVNGSAAGTTSIGAGDRDSTPGPSCTDRDAAATVSESSSAPGSSTGKKPKVSSVLQAQIRQLKPLLSVSSRLGRALAELFGLLVKLCVGSPVRQRRNQQQANQGGSPTPAARAVASALTRLLANGLSWEPPHYAPVPKLRLTFLVCSVGFTSPMLFDEKKQPFHLMLQKFVSSGGQSALFQAFFWALSMDGKVPFGDGLEHPDLPEGSGEFLDAWLMLVEKMVNPKTVLESPHSVPNKPKPPTQPVLFNPTHYLIATQKAAFHAVMNLWNKKPLKVYGSRMCESLLAILSHIIRGEGIIKEQLAKEKEEENSAAPSTAEPGPSDGSAAPRRDRRTLESEVNQQHMQQLMDMGFTRAQAMDGLLNASSVEQATEYILANPVPAQVEGEAPRAPGMEVEMTDEEQMMRAIALSLGESVVMSTDQADQSAEKKEEDEEQEKQEKEDPLDKSVLDNFTEGMLEGCLNLLDMVPETVYRVCDLLTVVTQRNGSQWRDKTLAFIVQEVRLCCEHMLSITSNCSELSSQDMGQKLTSSDHALKFGVRLHLLSLLLEDMNVPCAEAIQKGSLLQLLVSVLQSTHHTLTLTPACSTPKWMAPLLLLLDLFEKIAVISQRKAQATVLRAGSSTWKWFDDSTGRWCKYSVGNNKSIHDAYMAGETSVRFQAGRRKYTVHFTNMVQLNEDTGNRRPVMLSIPTAEDKAAAATRDEKEKAATAAATGACTVEALTALVAGSQDSTPGPSGKSEEGKMETETTTAEDSASNRAVSLVGLGEDQVDTIIRSLVSLIGIPVESETMHALLRLVLRLTREHRHAVVFARLGGPRLLLKLTQGATFPGFLSLVTLLFRHILDEPAALRNCMEKVMRSACAGIGSSASGVGNGSVGSKEMHYVLRVLGPAACRCPKFFVNVAQDSLQISLPLQPKIQRDEDESRFAGPNTPQLLKCSSLKMVDLVMDASVKEFLCDLLNALVVKHACKQDEAHSSEAQAPQMVVESGQEAAQEDVGGTISEQGAALSAQTSSSDIPAEEDTSSQTESAASQEAPDKESKDKQPVDDKKGRPLFPKSAILRLLSEVIKSYGNCTQLITQYSYDVIQSDLLAEPCSLLAFVLDQLLPQCQAAGDKDCPALARVFLASIASCNHCPEAQTTLVSEVKAALQRALCLPESAEKHSRVQALVGIISTIMEACPSPSGSGNNSVFKNQQTPGNVMVKLMIRKGLVVDLARVPHSLDLSSPYMAATVNAALKPLETLSRAHNTPGNQLVKNKAGGDAAPPFVQEDQGGTTHPATSNETTMRNLLQGEESAQGEDNLDIQDVTDNPAAQADLDNTHQHSIVEPDPDSLNSDTELDQIVQQIFQSDSRSAGGVLADYTMVTDQTPGQEESQEVMIDVIAAEGDDEMEQDNSQLNQEASDGEDDAIHRHSHRTDPNLDEESPDSPSEGEDEEDFHELEQDDDDEDDDDDDDEGDEDEEGSDMEGDEDDYQEMDNSAALNQEDDFLLQLEDMHAAGGGGGHIIFSDNTQVCSYQLPVSMQDSDNANEASVPSLPPAPTGVSAAHPLLVRQSENMMNVRVPRSRHRASYRFTPGTHTFHVNMHSAAGSTRPTPPVILQRLLGPNATADILQLTHNIPQDQYADAMSGSSGVLSSIPSTLTRWTEEARVLDGDSVHDCVTVVKPEVVDTLIKKRDAEVAEWREKRKKMAVETAGKDKGKEAAGEGASNTATSTTTPIANAVTTISSMAAASLMQGTILTPQVSNTTTVVDVSVAQGGQPPASIVSSSTADRSSVERLAQSLVSEALQAGGPSASLLFTPSTTPAPTAPFSLLSTFITPSTAAAALSSTAASVLPSSTPTMLTVRRELNPAVSGAANPAGGVSMLGLGSAPTPIHTSSPSATSSLPDPHSMTSALLTSNTVWSEAPGGMAIPGMLANSAAVMMPPGSILAPPSGVFAQPPPPLPQANMTPAAGMMVPPPSTALIRTPMMSHLLQDEQQDSHAPHLLPPMLAPRVWMQQQQPVPQHRWESSPVDHSSFMQQPTPSPNPTLPVTNPPSQQPSSSVPGLEPVVLPQQLPLAQQAQPQQAMDTTSGGAPIPMPFNPASVGLPIVYSSGGLGVSTATYGASSMVPPGTYSSVGAYSSPQPILNLQEFLSGLAPSEESAPFVFPFGGGGPLGRESSVEDAFMAGLSGVNAQETQALDPGAMPSAASSEGLSIAPEPTPVLSGLDLSRIVVSQSTSGPTPTPSSSGSSTDPSPTSTTATVTTSAVMTTTVTTTTATSVSSSAGPQEGTSTTGEASTSSRAPGTVHGEELPENVDPSFLAALPDNIRQEVIADQLRLQRIQQRAQQQQQQSAETPGAMDVSPEFLAALPPNIQEEVLAQQRAEQARIQAAQRGGAEDHLSFIDTLSPQLRQSVLCDLDDSSISALPEHVAAEARELRQELEERHRRLVQERLFTGGAASLSAILRNPSLYGRLGSRYAIRATGVPALPRSRWSFGLSSQNRGAGTSGGLPVARLRGRHLLDHEALTCLLVLLFMDEPKLNTNRLFRVLRNLCYHAPTRTWILRALLSILQRTSECQPDAEDSRLSHSGTAPVSSSEKGSRGRKGHHQPPAVVASPIDPTASGSGSGSGWARSETTRGPGAWLSISLEAALGCRANVFQVQRVSGGKKSCVSTPQASSVSIHPQAAPVVCRHVLDTLISLAKVFPSHFLPTPKVREVPSCDAREDRDAEPAPSGGARPKSHSVSSGTLSPRLSRSDRSTATSTTSEGGRQESDIWSLLLKLDGAGQSRRGKGVQRAHSNVGSMQAEAEALGSDYKSSALGQLMAMLSHPVVRRSQPLTDKLLRLLGLVAVSVQDNANLSLLARANAISASHTTTTTTTATTTSTSTSAPPAHPAPVTVSSVTPAVCLSVSTDAAATPSSVPHSDVAATTSTTSTTATSTGIVPSVETAAPSSDNKPSEDKKDQKESGAGEEEPILMSELKMAVQVLTSKACSEEGLDDATNLLLQLSWANNSTRHTILALLLEGARTLGLTVRHHICLLLEELRVLNVQQVDDSEDSRDAEMGSAQQVKGMVPDRFSGGSGVVVSAPSKIKSGRELQLPSMSQLTNKTSSQHFFLRILKVIIQLRDAARSASKKKTGRAGSNAELASIIDLAIGLGGELEAEAEGLIELVRQRPSTRRHLRPNEALAALGLRSALDPPGENAPGGPGPVPAPAAAQAPAPAGDQEEGGAGAGGGTQAAGSLEQPAEAPAETPMEVDQQPGPSSSEKKEEPPQLPRLSEQLFLDELWSMLGDCLKELARTPDHHAVLILQPAVEAFFIVHAGEKEAKRSDHATTRREDQMAHLNVEMAPPSPSPGPSVATADASSISITRENSTASIVNLPPDTQKFLKFAETHRTVLNQILRQSTLPLAEGPFSVLVDHTRMLDFDVKRRYFRQELERMEEGMRREDLPVHVRREHVFEDSFRELFRRTPEEWKQRFYIVFEGEEGQDAGGLLREWYLIISREIFNENYVLFKRYPRDGVTYTINPSSHFNSNHLSYFKFVGRIIAKAIYDNKLLECYFTRSFYKHVLGLLVKYTDMESEDFQFYQSLVYLLENDITDMGAALGDLNFSAEVEEFGVRETRDLIDNGSNIAVTEENKRDYVKLVCQMKMTGAIRQQLNAFLEGFYDIIPKKLVGIFTEQELELLISGLPTIDIDDLKANTEYHKYQPTSLQIQWFWRALRSFDQAERANFLQFVTGTSKVPLQGFASLEGMNGHQKFQIHRDDRSTDRLPSAHTCFNQLDLPAYETYDKLRKMLLLAVSECSEGFGLA